jgi:hypothetical protein
MWCWRVAVDHPIAASSDRDPGGPSRVESSSARTNELEVSRRLTVLDEAGPKMSLACCLLLAAIDVVHVTGVMAPRIRPEESPFMDHCLPSIAGKLSLPSLLALALRRSWVGCTLAEGNSSPGEGTEGARIPSTTPTLQGSRVFARWNAG